MRCGRGPGWQNRLREERRIGREGPARRKVTMSRIHEALKKAEQERAATQGASTSPNFTTSPVVDPPVFAETPAATVAPPAPAHAGMPAFAGPFSTDTLLARCA